MPLILDDTPARPITRQFDRYYEVIDDADAAYKLVEQQEQLPPDSACLLAADVHDAIRWSRDSAFQKKIPASWEVWAKTTDNDLKSRLEKLGQTAADPAGPKTDLEMKGQTLTAEDARILSEAEFESDLGGLEQILRRYEARPWEKQAKEEQQRQEQDKAFPAGRIRRGIGAGLGTQ